MTQRTHLPSLLGLLGWILLCFVAAGVGGLASAQAAGFYAELLRPTWGPPGWLFGPVWSLLYVLMAVAAWIVWKRRGFRGATTALWLFVLQLVLNALWTWIFFVWHQGAWAFAEIMLLWVLILATILAFWRQSAIAGILLLPYLAWVTFASALCFAIWRLNPNTLG